MRPMRRARVGRSTLLTSLFFRPQLSRRRPSPVSSPSRPPRPITSQLKNRRTIEHLQRLTFLYSRKIGCVWVGESASLRFFGQRAAIMALHDLWPVSYIENLSLKMRHGDSYDVPVSCELTNYAVSAIGQQGRRHLSRKVKSYRQFQGTLSQRHCVWDYYRNCTGA